MRTILSTFASIAIFVGLVVFALTFTADVTCDGSADLMY